MTRKAFYIASTIAAVAAILFAFPTSDPRQESTLPATSSLSTIKPHQEEAISRIPSSSQASVSLASSLAAEKSTALPLLQERKTPQKLQHAIYESEIAKYVTDIQWHCTPAQCDMKVTTLPTSNTNVGGLFKKLQDTLANSPEYANNTVSIGEISRQGDTKIARFVFSNAIPNEELRVPAHELVKALEENQRLKERLQK